MDNEKLLEEKQLMAAELTINALTKYQWEVTKFKDSDDTTTDVLEIDVTSHDDRIYTVTHVAAVDVNKVVNSVRMYNVKAGQKHLLKSGKPSAAAVSLDWQGELVTGPGQKLRVEFWNTDVGNDLFFTASGYWTKK